jgi:hypothetical protein
MRRATSLLLVAALGGACSRGASGATDFVGDYLGPKSVLKIHETDGGVLVVAFPLPTSDKEGQPGSQYVVERRDQRIVASSAAGATAFSATRTGGGLDAVIEGQRQAFRRVDLSTGTALQSADLEQMAKDSISSVLTQLQSDGRCGNASMPAAALEKLSHALESAAFMERVTKREGLLIDRYECHGRMIFAGGKASKAGDVSIAFVVRVPRAPEVPAPEPSLEWSLLGERLPDGLSVRALCALRGPLGI